MTIRGYIPLRRVNLFFFNDTATTEIYTLTLHDALPISAYLGEEADYDPAQAKLAGVQRLLVIAGYDANPIDGLEGKKTTAALDQFLKDRRLPADAANGATFFSVLLDAVKEADGLGFSWCNETPFAVMAAIGIDENGAVTTRGWYRVAAGKCGKPDLP